MAQGVSQHVQSVQKDRNGVESGPDSSLKYRYAGGSSKQHTENLRYVGSTTHEYHEQ